MKHILLQYSGKSKEKNRPVGRFTQHAGLKSNTVPVACLSTTLPSLSKHLLLAFCPFPPAKQ
jgi:hypothetical protein